MSSVYSILRLASGILDLGTIALGDFCIDENTDFCKAWQKYEILINAGVLTTSVVGELALVRKQLLDNYPATRKTLTQTRKNSLDELFEISTLTARYDNLSLELKDIIDNFGFGSLKLADNGSDIIFLAANGTDEVARIVGGKLVPKRFISSGTDIGNSVDNLQMVKNGDNIGFRIANPSITKLGINFTDFKATVNGGFPNPNLADEAFYLYGEQNWGELYDLFQREHLNPVTDAKGITTYWPPANGGYNIRKGQRLIPAKYDRYQKTLIPREQSLTDPFNPTFTGTYTSPLDNGKLPYEARALEGLENSYDLYYEIEILEELTFTGDLADVIPWHGFKGEGVQMNFNFPTDWKYDTWSKLLREDKIKITIKSSPSGKYDVLSNGMIKLK